MKTLICSEPGKLVYGTADIPDAKAGFAIIRIRRIGVCGTDLHAFEGTQPFFTYPRILGHELSGELINIETIEGFKTGDLVTCIPYRDCGHCIACRSGKPNCCVHMQVFGVHIDGGLAEYLQIPVRLLIHGSGLSSDELALAEPLAIAAHGVARAEVQQGEFVVVIGAGPIGMGVIEFARIAGAQVVAVDTNEHRLAFCRENLKVVHTINPLQEDVVSKLEEITNGDMPTVVIDASGNQSAINRSFHYMAHGARYVLVGLQKNELIFSHPEFHKREGSLMSSRNATRKDFDFVIACITQGLINPDHYITHKISFDDASGTFKDFLNAGNGVIKAMICID